MIQWGSVSFPLEAPETFLLRFPFNDSVNSNTMFPFHTHRIFGQFTPSPLIPPLAWGCKHSPFSYWLPPFPPTNNSTLTQKPLPFICLVLYVEVARLFPSPPGICEWWVVPPCLAIAAVSADILSLSEPMKRPPQKPFGFRGAFPPFYRFQWSSVWKDVEYFQRQRPSPPRQSRHNFPKDYSVS